MATPSPVQASDALEELVNQFSDPLSFFRELIQNSLDAGSAEVEVRIEYDAGEADDGAMVIHVDDWGDGMDKEIIDKRLTRLFSSSKDGDMTKIGKFGIGFVSVFAIDPEAVVIDTSRGGEHWRIIFDEKRAFSCLRRDQPVDGTKVSIYKTATRATFDGFVVAAERTVRFWCKHTKGEVRFQGEPINEAFDLDYPCKVVRDDGFSQIVVAHPPDGQTFHGYYNQGLTLAEGSRGPLEGLAFKVSSPHLEHTLTRDNVIRDESFHKVMADIQRLAHQDLCRLVFAQLEGYAGSAGSDPRREYLFSALLWHVQVGHPVRADDLRRPIFPLCGGARASLRDVEGILTRTLRDRRLLWSALSNPLTSALRHAGHTVFELPETSVGLKVLRWLAQRGSDARDRERFEAVRRAKELYCLPLPPAEDPGPAAAALSTALSALLEEHGAKLSGIRFGHFAYEESAIGDAIAITESTAGEPTPLEEANELGYSLFSSRRALAVNLDHAAVADLVGLAAHAPALAAYKLIKLFFLGRELDVALASKLATIAARI